ncbi:hypothetical protein V8C34DRAFT_312814 [Trichoderma compactum]
MFPVAPQAAATAHVFLLPFTLHTLHISYIRFYVVVSIVTAASITRILDITMSSVMCVTITLNSGQDIHAVLKLYDRRFGQALFESFVRRNAISPFLTQLAQDQERELVPIQPHHHLDGDNFEGSEKYEATLWKDCDDMFHCETKAYELLKDLQGTEAPRLLAAVRLVDTGSSIPSDLIDGPDAKYWDVDGILLQFIPGVHLINLDNSSIDVRKWPILVQRSVDLVYDINANDVVMMDCSPRNVIVNQQSQQPFVIDFAQCWFKHEIEMWESGNEEEDEEDGKDEEKEDEVTEIDLEAECWYRVASTRNLGAIRCVMSMRLWREKGVKIKVQYPDILIRPPE